LIKRDFDLFDISLHTYPSTDYNKGLLQAPRLAEGC